MEKIIDRFGEAYSKNPLITGLFVLNVVSIAGAGWALNESDKRNIAYLEARDKDVSAWRTKALELVSHCVVPEK